MCEINLGEAKINLDGEWFATEDLTNRIQEKMQTGDMKFSDLAAALEKLDDALKNAITLEIKVVLSKEEYEKLKSIGGDDDSGSVTKAIMAFIGGSQAETEAEVKGNKKLVIKCPKCKSPIDITSDERPLDVECPNCGTGGRLTPENKWAKLT